MAEFYDVVATILTFLTFVELFFGLAIVILIKDIEKNIHLKILGPEPLKNSFNFVYFKNYISGRNRTVKNLLMDQRFVSGLLAGRNDWERLVFLRCGRSLEPLSRLHLLVCPSWVRKANR